MASTQIQNTFNLGELDPLILARIDFEGYYKGARKLRDAISIPQGGCKRRFGHLFVDTILDIGSAVEISNQEYVRMLVFTYSREKSYLLVFRPEGSSAPIVPATDVASIDVYLNNVYQVSVTTAYTLDQLTDLRWVKAEDRVLFLHPDVKPKQLVRGANDTTWTLSDQNFIYYPIFDFTIIDAPANAYTDAGNTITPSATSGSVTLTVAGGATPFTGNHVGGLYVGGGGIARITAVASATSATAATIEDFSAAAAILGADSFIGEPIWGDGTAAHAVPGVARGWPAVGAFFQNRLIYGRTPYLSNAISASTINNFEDFDDSEALDTNGFTYLLKSESLNYINSIVGTNSLIVLTTDSIFSTNPLVDLPITPGNVFLNEQSREGSNDVAAAVIDDQVIFVDHNGKGIKSFIYDLLQTNYQVEHLSILSTHLIKDPIESASFENPNTEDGTYYLAINEDGTMAILNLMKSQMIKGWTLGRSTGKFVDICSDKQQSYVLVKRQQASATETGNNQQSFRVNQYANRFDEITTVLNDSGADAALYTDTEQTDDYLYICNEAAFTSLAFTLGTAADITIAPEFQFLDKDGIWTTFTPTDGTTGFTASGTISWNYSDTVDWGVNDIEVWANYVVERKYWIRIKRTATGLTTLPEATTCLVDLVDRLFIEQIRFDYLLDASIYVTSDANGDVNGLGELYGHSVYLLRQTANTYGVNAGIPKGPYIVDSTGTISLGADFASTDFVAGINYIPEMIPMPPVGQFNLGTNVYLPKLIKSLYLDYYESAGLYVDNIPISTMQIDVSVVNVPLDLKTDFNEEQPWAGRNPRTEILISQPEPLPFTVIGIGYKVEF